MPRSCLARQAPPDDPELTKSLTSLLLMAIASPFVNKSVDKLFMRGTINEQGGSQAVTQ